MSFDKCEISSNYLTRRLLKKKITVIREMNKKMLNLSKTTHSRKCNKYQKMQEKYLLGEFMAGYFSHTKKKNKAIFYLIEIGSHLIEISRFKCLMLCASKQYTEFSDLLNYFASICLFSPLPFLRCNARMLAFLKSCFFECFHFYFTCLNLSQSIKIVKIISV